MISRKEKGVILSEIVEEERKSNLLSVQFRRMERLREKAKQISSG